MTITHSSTPSRARFALTALASSAVLAVSGTLAPALMAPSNAASSPLTTSAHQDAQRRDHRVVHHDARHDVLIFDVEDETRTPAPHDRTTDIVRTVVDHQVDGIVIQAQVRQLRRSSYRLMIADLLTSDGRRFELVVDYATKPIGPRVSLERSGSGADVRCPGATWSVDRTSERVSATIPNSCLRDPAWIRVGVALVAAPPDLKTSRVDDSRARGHVTDRLKLGPRQHRA